MTNFNAEQYWEKRLLEKWGLQGVGFSGLGRYYNDWLYKVRKRVFYRHIPPLFKDWSEIDVLDIGSGTGFYVNLWRSLKVKSVTATDITSISVEKIKEKFPDVECFQLDIGKNLPGNFSNKQYHIISAFDIFFHITDDNCYQKAIENISQMLQPGGIFVLSELFIHTDTVRTQHQVLRPLNEIEAMLKKTGFEVQLRAPMFAFMNYPVDSKSAFLKKSWNWMLRPVRKVKFLGALLGALLYPFELMLTSQLKESPSTELMICEKRKQEVI